MIDPAIHTLIAIGLAVLFGTAAVHKVRSPAMFVATLADYRLLPPQLSSAAAVLLIALEFALAAGLLWPATRGLGGIAGASLLLVYAAAIAINLRRGRRHLDCGCTLQHRPIGGWMVTRNSVLAAAALLLVIPMSSRTIQSTDVATIVAALCVIVLLYAAADLLLARAGDRD